jgi:hypothetical protein
MPGFLTQVVRTPTHRGKARRYNATRTPVAGTAVSVLFHVSTLFTRCARSMAASFFIPSSAVCSKMLAGATKDFAFLPKGAYEMEKSAQDR